MTADTVYDVARQVRAVDPGLTCEVVGSWLWVGGDTFAHRDALKALGLRWSPRRRLWHWCDADHRGYGHSKADMWALRAKYGSQSLTD